MCGPRFSPGRGFGRKSRRGPRDLAWVFPATTVGMPEGRRARKLAPEAAIPRRCECSGLWGQPHRLRPALSAHTPPKTAGGYLGGLRSAGRLILALLGFFSIGQLECADS